MLAECSHCADPNMSPLRECTGGRRLSVQSPPQRPLDHGCCEVVSDGELGDAWVQ